MSPPFLIWVSGFAVQLVFFVVFGTIHFSYRVSRDELSKTGAIEPYITFLAGAIIVSLFSWFTLLVLTLPMSIILNVRKEK